MFDYLRDSYQSEFPHGIMFHHLHDDYHVPTGQGSISSKEFEGIIKCIGISNILSPEDWINKLMNNQLKKEDICITFDDALLCQFTIALPVLEKYNLRAFWFIYSSVFNGELEKFEIYRKFRLRYFDSFDEFFDSFIRTYSMLNYPKIDGTKYGDKIGIMKSQYSFYSINDILYRIIRDDVLSDQQFESLMDNMLEENGVSLLELADGLWMADSHIKKLSDVGHFIGVHAYNHPYALAKLSYESQLDQLQKNYNHIKKATNKDPVSMSYPNNSYNQDTINILKELDIVCGFRAIMGKTNQKSIVDSALTLPRIDHSNIIRLRTSS